MYNGKGLDGFFLHFPRSFFPLGRLAYVRYRVIELFPIGVVGLVFLTVPLIKVFIFWVDWRNRVIELPLMHNGVFHIIGSSSFLFYSFFLPLSALQR